MSIRISSPWARSPRPAVFLPAVILLLAGSLPQGAQAQLSGSISVGRSQTTSTYQDGQIETRSQGGALNVAFGRGIGIRRGPGVPVTGVPPIVSARPRDPYGLPNYGRGRFFDGFGSGVDDGGFVDGGLVSGVATVSPHSHLSSGLIEENFRIMRRTSPFPNQFAAGIYNPRFRFRSSVPAFGGAYFPPYDGFFYGGYGVGYGPGIYPGYVPSVYSYYGDFYPQFLPRERVYIIEREVVRDRDNRDAAPREREESDGASGSARKEARAAPQPPSGEGEYYLSPAPRPRRSGVEVGAPGTGETLDDAAAQIRQAWMNGDYLRFKALLRETGKVRIYLKGRYRYSVDAADFGQMTHDAMARIDTVSFTLDTVRHGSDDRAFVSGKHVYYDPERNKHEVYVSYGLVKQEGRWRIIEGGSGTEPISSHTD